MIAVPHFNICVNISRVEQIIKCRNISHTKQILSGKSSVQRLRVTYKCILIYELCE